MASVFQELARERQENIRLLKAHQDKDDLIGKLREEIDLLNRVSPTAFSLSSVRGPRLGEFGKISLWLHDSNHRLLWEPLICVFLDILHTCATYRRDRGTAAC